MEEQMIAGRIWAGELRVTAPITPDQDFVFISNVVQEAIYFHFFGEHFELGDEIDLMIGLCHDPLREDGLAVLRFPAIVRIFDPKLANEDALNLALGILRDSINGWYDQLELCLDPRVGRGVMENFSDKTGICRGYRLEDPDSPVSAAS